VDVLLEAVTRLASERPQLRVGIAGDGPLRVELQGSCRRLGVSGQVDFLGMVTDVPAFLKRGRIFVLCSESEGLPFALIEAICCGLVPVATPVGDIPTLIHAGRTGWLTPVEDADALAATLSMLLDDPALWQTVHRHALAQRSDWELDRAAEVWRSWWRTFPVEDATDRPLPESSADLLDKTRHTEASLERSR
jgi:glycosyltransferase involved in cell wall biosynthesis